MSKPKTERIPRLTKRMVQQALADIPKQMAARKADEADRRCLRGKYAPDGVDEQGRHTMKKPHRWVCEAIEGGAIVCRCGYGCGACLPAEVMLASDGAVVQDFGETPRGAFRDLDVRDECPNAPELTPWHPSHPGYVS